MGREHMLPARLGPRNLHLSPVWTHVSSLSAHPPNMRRVLCLEKALLPLLCALIDVEVARDIAFGLSHSLSLACRCYVEDSSGGPRCSEALFPACVLPLSVTGYPRERGMLVALYLGGCSSGCLIWSSLMGLSDSEKEGPITK
uniref:Uncharacterized protein n=1 Tax=Knipowitschia caucasica TaxID=637954 RepID=A0AAV2KVX6_KNICA